MLEKINEIVDFWFQQKEITSSEMPFVPERHWSLSHVSSDDAFKTFEKVYYLAVNQELQFWLEQPKSCLAFILLVNELAPRLHRDSPLTYEHSHLAVEAADYGRAHKLDKELPLIQRYFFYRPYACSEDINAQKLSLKLMSQLVKEAKQHKKIPKSLIMFLEAHYSQQVDHYDTILSFGRFPQRNNILERESTQEELLFLGLPNNRF
tara:strand:- start:87093 stop:87713 length:621 start_codon:yes stop_codon:yes gene_type:complete